MNSPMQHLEFGPFKSVNESVNPEKLSPEELVLLENMRLDSPIGIPSTRKGFSRYTTHADAREGYLEYYNNNPGTINSIYDVVDSEGTNYLIVNIPALEPSGYKAIVRISDDGGDTWSSLKLGLTTNNKLRMSPFGDKFFFTNSKEKPFYANLVDTQSSNLEIERPDVSLVTTTFGAFTEEDTIRDTLYRYLIVYVTQDGQKSNPSVGIETDYSADPDGTTSITLANLPVSSDSRVISKQIYRTKEKGFITFYLVGTIDNSITTFVDTTLDANLDTTSSPEYMNVPIEAKYIVSNNDRVFFANITKTYTNRVIPPAITSEVLVTITTPGTIIPAGTYKYAMSFVDVAGNESSLTPIKTVTTESGADAIRIYGFCRPLIGWLVLDTSIKFIRFYRTTDGGSTYYFFNDFDTGTIDLNNAAHPVIYDSTADVDLTISYPKAINDAADTVELKTAIVFSNLSAPQEFPELNYIEIYPDDGDAITGIFDDDNGIIIFKEKSICKLYTNGDPSNWQVQKLVYNVGCDQPDSIFKYKTSYFFVFKNKAYIFEGIGVKEISYKRKPTFDSIDTITGSTFWDDSQWYILSVIIGGSYYLLCYDLKLETWYRFSISRADVISRKEFGADKGKLLIGGNLYINTYNEDQAYDNESGSNQSITVQLKTKDYLFPDSFVRGRLRFLFLNYLRLKDTITKQILFKLTEPVNNATRILNDTDDVNEQKLFKAATDGMLGGLKRCNKINFSFHGEALSLFYNARLDYLAEPWGVPKKHTSELTGWGVSVGTDAGVNTT